MTSLAMFLWVLVAFNDQHQMFFNPDSFQMNDRATFSIGKLVEGDNVISVSAYMIEHNKCGEIFQTLYVSNVDGSDMNSVLFDTRQNSMGSVKIRTICATAKAVLDQRE